MKKIPKLFTVHPYRTFTSRWVVFLIFLFNIGVNQVYCYTSNTAAYCISFDITKQSSKTKAKTKTQCETDKQETARHHPCFFHFSTALVLVNMFTVYVHYWQPWKSKPINHLKEDWILCYTLLGMKFQLVNRQHTFGLKDCFQEK